MSTATRSMQGKRTGVQLAAAPDRDDHGLEDEDAYFAGAQSPPAPAASTKKIRFSLDSKAEEGSAVGSKAAARKVIQQSGRVSMSPSNLSAVSTALPEEKEMARAAQDDDYEEEEVVVAEQPTAESPGGVAFGGDDDDDMMPPADDDDDDDGELIPPAPPQDEDEEEPDVPAEEAPLATQDEPVPMEDDTDDDDDDDKEGPGFDMADPEPSAEEEEDDVEAEPASKKNKKKRKTAESESEEEEEEEAPAKKKAKKKRKVVEDDTVKTAPKRKKTKKSKYKFANFSPKGIVAGPREFKAIPVSDFKDSPDSANRGLRRSKRARIKPLEFWKNEKIEWGPNDFDEAQYDSIVSMAVPVAINKAEPTPYKQRKVSAPPADGKSKSKKKSTKEQEVSAEMEVFDDRKLRKTRRIMDGEEAVVMDDYGEEVVDMQVVAFADRLEPRPLPRKSRPKGESREVSLAAQAFNISNTDNPAYPSFLMGNLVLPPTAIKDSEGVGACAQTFTVVKCQPKAFEVAYGDPEQSKDGAIEPKTAQRFLLSQGDMFRIPPGNCYRLENHSKTTECMLTWTIIRANQFDDE